MKKFSNGTVLNNRYRILKSLGEGAFGVVYMVEDMVNHNTRRAMKEFAKEAIPKGKEELLLRETRFLAGLSHPGLPKVVDQFFLEQNYYMVMDYIEGDTLDSIFIMMDEPFTEEEILPWFFELSKIFDYLHSQDPPVIYRDLKPSNIIINSQNEAKLIDFGTARFFNPVKVKDTFIMGTPGFAAPEQYGSEQSDARSDIYALGATFYFLLTRRNMETAKFQFPPVKTINPKISENMEEVLKKCLELDPKERYASVKELQKDLEARFKKVKSSPPPMMMVSDEDDEHSVGKPMGKAAVPLSLLIVSAVLFLVALFVPLKGIGKIILGAVFVIVSVFGTVLASYIWISNKEHPGERSIPTLVFWASIVQMIVYGICSYVDK
ncbi:MAG: serine/threonine protein kinase [Candidatus Xenobiia bacterium LiM19]